MTLSGELGLKLILKRFRSKVLITWSLVLVENIQMALIPLLMGWAIDGLMSGDSSALVPLAGCLAGLTLVMVIRRIFDTRAYGSIRVRLGVEVDKRHRNEPLSTRNARLDMSRELVDFLEEKVPELITACVQVIMAVIVLASFHGWLAVAAGVLSLVILLLYSGFHQRLFRLNAELNNQLEKQVGLLATGSRRNLLRHLKQLKKQEVSLSDMDAFLYGLIFLMAGGFVIFNLWFSASLSVITAGKIFSIVTYSWEFVESMFMLPVTLQSLTRLQEISHRLNGRSRSLEGGSVSSADARRTCC